MEKKVRLLVGPTTVPTRVLNAMNREMINHRSLEYAAIQERVEKNLKKIFNTENNVLILTSSGTGAMEAVVQNCFSPGDKVVVPVNGMFGDRFAIISETFGLNVKRVNFELGETADVNEVMKYVDDDTKGVLLVHNESTTGVFNDLEAYGEALKDTDTLLITDSISGAGGLKVKMDEWHVDIVLTASQKALMAPTGVAFVAVNEKAYKAMENATLPTFYFDLLKARDINKLKNETPWSTGVYTMFAVEEALNMLLEEGLENIYKRNLENKKLLIEGIKKLGLQIFPRDERYASPTLTAIRTEGKSKQIIDELMKRGIMIAEGLEPIEDDTIRVGTMGYVSKNDINAFLAALEEVLVEID